MPQPATSLSAQEANDDPSRQFAEWFAQAAAGGVSAPEAAAVATATPEAVPSVRMVLVKSAGPSGFVFFTNYESRKGCELAANPRGALLFHWDPPGRQVRIEGLVERTSADESAAYAHSRGRGSQLSALASPQSRVIESRAALEERVADLRARYDGVDLPVSESWGGFRLIPDRFEFWQQRDDRLHDRLLYTRGPDQAWRLERLAP